MGVQGCPPIGFCLVSTVSLLAAAKIEALSNGARGGAVIQSLDYPGIWEVNITMGALPGANRFMLSAGEVSRTFSIAAAN